MNGVGSINFLSGETEDEFRDVDVPVDAFVVGISTSATGGDFNVGDFEGDFVEEPFFWGFLLLTIVDFFGKVCLITRR